MWKGPPLPDQVESTSKHCLYQLYPLLQVEGASCLLRCTQDLSLCSPELWCPAGLQLQGRKWHLPLSLCSSLQCSVLHGPGEVTQAASMLPSVQAQDSPLPGMGPGH